MDNELFRWIEFCSWIAGGVAAILAFLQIIREVRRNREQREAELHERENDRLARIEDLRWRRSEAAKRLIDEMVNAEDADIALKVLDWPGHTFLVENGAGQQDRITVSREHYRESLAVPKRRFSARDQFICRAFDGLLWSFGWFEHHVRTGLVLFEDVRFPSDYYIEIMARDKDVFSQYLKHYGLDRAASFMNRFSVWSEASECHGRPQLGFNDAFRGTTTGDYGGVPTDGRAFPVDD